MIVAFFRLQTLTPNEKQLNRLWQWNSLRVTTLNPSATNRYKNDHESQDDLTVRPTPNFRGVFAA
jgi:hypothetical protein